MSTKKTLHALAVMLLAAPAAHAGGVTIQKFDPANGELSPWAQGSMDHAPSRLLERGEPWLLDSCGQVFGFSEGTFGDMALEGPMTPLYSLRDVKHFDVNDYSGVAITGEGKLVKLILDRATRTRVGEAGFDWIDDPGSTIPAGDTSILVHTRAGAGTYLFKKNGDLMKIEAFGEGRDKGRYLGARGGWKDVTHAIVAELLMGPNDVQQVLVTAHQDGSIKRHIITGSNGGDYSLETAALNGTFEDTAALMPGSGFNQSHVLRLTNGGDLYRVDVSKGVEERLGAEGAFAGGIVHVGESFGYYVSSSGDFSTGCPEKPVVQEVVDPYADFDYEPVVEEFDAMYKAAEEFSVIIDERIEVMPPNDLLGKSEADIDAAMNAFVAEMAAFEKETLEPMVKRMEAHKKKYEKYGEFEALNALVREKSNRQYRIDEPYIEDEIEDYNQYKAVLWDIVLEDARLNFAIAEVQNDPKEVAKSYMEAVPIAKWALKLNPESEEAKGYIEKAAGLAGAAISAEKAAIAKAEWPEDRAEFCECDPAEIKEKVLYMYRRVGAEHKDYQDGTRIVAVRIRGAMKPGETNVLGEILDWHFPVWIAETNPNEPWFLTVRTGVVETETNDRNSRFVGWDGEADAYQIPIERVAIDDEEALAESLAIIEETTGLTPDDMPEDALDPSVTGIPGADGGSAGGGSDGGGTDGASGGSAGGGSSSASAGGGSEISESADGDSGSNARGDSGDSNHDVAERSADDVVADDAGGSGLGWLLVIVLIGGAAFAVWHQREKVQALIGRHVSDEQRAALAAKVRAAQKSLKEKSTQAAEKAREAGTVAAQKAREAGEAAADKARQKADELRK